MKTKKLTRAQKEALGMTKPVQTSYGAKAARWRAEAAAQEKQFGSSQIARTTRGVIGPRR